MDEEFRRRVITPHWCEGDPTAWTTPQKIGIAQFALDGKVGHFNLSWWLLDRREPPPVMVYRNTNIMWVIMCAPHIRVSGRTLIEHASMLRHQQFNTMLLAQEQYGVKRFEGQGMRWGTLAVLASRKTFQRNFK